MSIIGRIFNFHSRGRQGTRDLRPNEIEVLRQTVQPIRDRRPVRMNDIIFGMVLGSILMSVLWIFGLLVWHAVFGQFVGV
jgi:hypothetical protein